MNINAVVAVAKKAASITAIKLRKHAPELLMALGGVSVVGGTVQACRSTLKVKDILIEKKELMEEIDRSEKTSPKLKDGSNYTPEDAKKDRKIVKLTTIAKIAKAYAPAALMIFLGFSCFASSHIIMKNRFSVMCTAYTALKKNYDALYNEFITYKRGALDSKNGCELNGDIMNTISEEDKPIISDMSMNGCVPYLFDETCPKWSKSPWRNKMLIESVLGDLQRDLRTKGFVFLNDVNKAFGLPLTPEGQYLGWTDKVPESDEYGIISLGLEVEKFISEVNAGKWDNISATGLMFNPNVHGNILEFI